MRPEVRFPQSIYICLDGSNKNTRMHAQAFPDIRQNNGRIVTVRNRMQFVIHLQMLLMINSLLKFSYHYCHIII